MEEGEVKDKQVLCEYYKWIDKVGVCVVEEGGGYIFVIKEIRYQYILRVNYTSSAT